MSGYSWLRDGLIPAESALLEGLWAYAWVTFAIAPVLSMPAHPFGLGWVVALILLPALAGRLLESLLPRRVRLRTWIAAAFVVLLFALFLKTQTLPNRSLLDWRWIADVVFPWASLEDPARVGVLGLGWFFGLVLVARGLWLASANIDDDSATRWFMVGLGSFLVLFAVLLISSPAGTVQRSLGLLLAIFFCIGLSWLALVKRQTIEEQAFSESSNRVGFSWLALLSSISLLMVIAALLIASLTGTTGMDLIGPVFFRLVLVVAYLLVALARILPKWLFGRMIQPNNDDLDQAVAALAQLNDGRRLPIPPHLLQGLLAVLAVALLAALLARLSRAGFRLASRDDERSSLWSWRLFWQQLLALLRRPSRPQLRLWGSSRAPRGESSSPVRAAQPSLTSIRGLYLAVLQWSRQHGYGRHMSRTPHEFVPDLRRLLPPELADDITTAYVGARYGREPGAGTEVERLLAAWDAAKEASAGR